LGAFHDSVVDQIAGWIVAARFAAGETLPIEQAICDELDVSRTVVREALKTLAAKGLVRSGPRVGTRVLPAESWNLLDPQVVGWRLKAGIDRTLVEDLIDMRLMIEPAAAERAAQRATAPDLERLARTYDAMERAAEGHGSYIEADLAFHQAMLSAAHNQFLSQLVPVVAAVLRLSFGLSVRSLESARASLPDHAALHAAIAQGRAEEARARVVAIIEAARHDIEEALREGTRADLPPLTVPSRREDHPCA
jgi:GntR family galactonate operon transcriptional repressor